MIIGRALQKMKIYDKTNYCESFFLLNDPVFYLGFAYINKPYFFKLHQNYSQIMDNVFYCATFYHAAFYHLCLLAPFPV